MKLRNSEGKLAEHYCDKKNKALFKAMNYFKYAIEALHPETVNVLMAGSALTSAMSHSQEFILSYLIKIAKTANLRSQGLLHDEAYYHPHLLRLAIKHLKTYINSFEDFTEIYFPQGFEELTVQLNAYDVNSEVFDPSERIFKSIEEKNKTLKWFEQGTALAKTKAKMKENKYIPGVDQKLNNQTDDIIENSKQEIDDTTTIPEPSHIASLISSSVVNSPVFTALNQSNVPMESMGMENTGEKKEDEKLVVKANNL